MALINVLKPFLLNLGNALKRFEAGAIEVEEEIASHWYTLAHAERLPDPVPEHVADPAAVEPEPTSEPPLAEEPVEPSIASDPVPAEPESVTTEPDGSTHIDTPDEGTEKAVLKAEAEALGIDVDGRWGVTRLQTEIAAKKSAG